ncbi:MAG: hypothetical protein ABMA14_21165 [Hyphomonadaceae bacterium]
MTAALLSALRDKPDDAIGDRSRDFILTCHSAQAWLADVLARIHGKNERCRSVPRPDQAACLAAAEAFQFQGSSSSSFEAGL